jgi:hypothetical protein
LHWQSVVWFQRSTGVNAFPSGIASLQNWFSKRDCHMDTEVFRASRWTRGNFLFPTVIEVTDKAVIRHKRSWFSKDDISFSLSKVASVHIKTGFIWADVLIESSGGTDPLASHGHWKSDARRIRELIETAQAALHIQE